jgi:hypothetical protein
MVSNEDSMGKMEVAITKLASSWGRGKKHILKEQQALLFARALSHRGGTFIFTDEHRKNGLDNIWEAMAYELHDPSANIRQKYENADMFATTYRQGFNAFNDLLLDLFEDQYILSVPRSVDGGRIEIITFDQSLEVNPKGAEGERTALEVWAKRGNKRIKGQITSIAKHLVRADGQEATLTKISNAAEEAINELPEVLKRKPRRMTSIES